MMPPAGSEPREWRRPLGMDARPLVRKGIRRRSARGPGALVGAAGGAAVGANASQGASENRTYQIVIHCDDGTYGTFAYGGYAPFRPGERVVLTPQGSRAGECWRRRVFGQVSP